MCILKPRDPIFYVLVALFGEDDEGKEVEITSATLLPQDCYISLFLLTFWLCLQQRESLCPGWQMEMRPSNEKRDPESLPLCQIETWVKFEEAEKVAYPLKSENIHPVNPFIPLSAWLCVQCPSVVTDPEWQQESLYSLARIRNLQYRYHQSFIGVSIKMFFLGYDVFWIRPFKILCPRHGSAYEGNLSIAKPWMPQAISSLAVEIPLWGRYKLCIFRVVRQKYHFANKF